MLIQSSAEQSTSCVRSWESYLEPDPPRPCCPAPIRCRCSRTVFSGAMSCKVLKANTAGKLQPVPVPCGGHFLWFFSVFSFSVLLCCPGSGSLPPSSPACPLKNRPISALFDLTGVPCVTKANHGSKGSTSWCHQPALNPYWASESPFSHGDPRNPPSLTDLLLCTLSARSRIFWAKPAQAMGLHSSDPADRASRYLQHHHSPHQPLSQCQDSSWWHYYPSAPSPASLLTFVLGRELPHGQGQRLVEAQLLRDQGLANRVLVVRHHAHVAAHLMDKGLQEDGGPALARVQGALPHHGAGRRAEGDSLLFSSSKGGSEVGLGHATLGQSVKRWVFTDGVCKTEGVGEREKGGRATAKPPSAPASRQGWESSLCHSLGIRGQRGLGNEGTAGWDGIRRCPGKTRCRR